MARACVLSLPLPLSLVSRTIVERERGGAHRDGAVPGACSLNQQRTINTIINTIHCINIKHHHHHQQQHHHNIAIKSTITIISINQCRAWTTSIQSASCISTSRAASELIMYM